MTSKHFHTLSRILCYDVVTLKGHLRRYCFYFFFFCQLSHAQSTNIYCAACRIFTFVRAFLIWVRYSCELFVNFFFYTNTHKNYCYEYAGEEIVGTEKIVKFIRFLNMQKYLVRNSYANSHMHTQINASMNFIKNSVPFARISIIAEVWHMKQDCNNYHKTFADVEFVCVFFLLSKKNIIFSLSCELWEIARKKITFSFPPLRIWKYEWHIFDEYVK